VIAANSVEASTASSGDISISLGHPVRPDRPQSAMVLDRPARPFGGRGGGGGGTPNTTPRPVRPRRPLPFDGISRTKYVKPIRRLSTSPTASTCNGRFMTRWSTPSS
jgi:hypothetical protein